MPDSTITFVVLGAVVVLFVSNRVPVAIMAAHARSMLALTGSPVSVLVSDAADDAGRSCGGCDVTRLTRQTADA